MHLISVLVVVAPLSVNAATLPIDGNYGTELGCRIARTGEYIESNDTQLLTPHSVGTSVSLCSFDSIEPTTDGGYKVDMTCSWEGEGPEGDIREKAEISGDPKAGYMIRFADGISWGPLKKC